MDPITAEEITGGLSEPDKMPGFGYGIPASACHVGHHMAQVDGTPCAVCYAFNRGHYRRYAVKRAQQKRLLSLEHALWVEAMVYLLADRPNRRNRRHFRWHDSGDLQDMAHLLNIVAVCEMTPEVSHFLPTRERGIVLSYLRNFGPFPLNLSVRLSATMIDGPPPVTPPGMGINTSTVHHRKSAAGHSCPAREKYQNTCGPCRACWDLKVSNISFPLH